MKVLMDTNAVLYYLSDSEILSIKIEFVISFITEIELLAYPHLSGREEKIVKQFLNFVDVIDINSPIKKLTISFRRKYKLKIPDAIICATSCFLKVPLVTNDRQLLRVEECRVIDYNSFRKEYCFLKS